MCFVRFAYRHRRAGSLVVDTGFAWSPAKWLNNVGPSGLRKDASTDLRVLFDIVGHRLSGLKQAREAVGSGRFFLIKAWGYGFWSDMNHVFGCLLLAEITGRIPVTHWGQNSLYTNGTDCDAFQFYFEPISDFGMADLQALDGATLFPAKWTIERLQLDNHQKWDGAGSRLSGRFYLRRRETIAISDFYIHLPDLVASIPKTHKWHGKSRNELYRLVADKYLKLRPDIAAAIDGFYRAHMADSTPTIAVHVRGTDKLREPDYKVSLQNYFDIIDRDAPDWRIFLLTDQAQCVESFRRRYGSRLVFTEAQRSNSKSGVHNNRTADPIALGVEIIRDTYLALRCHKFVGHGLTNPSCIASVLKDWPEGDCTLLGPSLLERKFAQRMRPRKKKTLLSRVIEAVSRK
jgi:protein O-GlcNAc transferase